MAKLFNSLPLLNRWIELDNGYRFKLQKDDVWVRPYALMFEDKDTDKQMPVYRVDNALEAINKICENIGATKVLNYPFEKLPELGKTVRLNDYWTLEVDKSVDYPLTSIWVWFKYSPKARSTYQLFNGFETPKKAIEFINSFCLNNNINPELPCAELSF